MATSRLRNNLAAREERVPEAEEVREMRHPMLSDRVMCRVPDEHSTVYPARGSGAIAAVVLGGH